MMSDLSLQIIQPKDGATLTGAALVPLVGAVSGDSSGLFFKWFSSLNANATEQHPELNKDNHSAAILNWSAPLAEFGSHAIVLAAADQDKNDLASVQAVKRSAMVGGAPPEPPKPPVPPRAPDAPPPPPPCVVHRLVAQIRTPAPNAQLSKSNATIEFLAPLRWAKQDPPGSGPWVDDTDYQKVNGITLELHIAPAGTPNPPRTRIPFDLAPRKFVRADEKTWFQRIGPLPANLGTGKHTLTLSVRAGGTLR